jgi:hypothetical protein
MAKAGPWICFRSMRGLLASNTLYVLRRRKLVSKEEQAAWALGLLTSEAREQARSIGRRYPDGLVKYEPKDLRSILLPQPRNTTNAIEIYGRAVSQLLAGDVDGATNSADQFLNTGRKPSRRR